MIRVQKEDFSVDGVLKAVLRGNAAIGGTAVFVGTVRGGGGADAVSAIDLEHYPGMTERELEKIETEARTRWDLADLVVIHRVGRLEAGANIVLVVAAARHRGEAFDACRFVIDQLKETATFWKKELTPEGERWVAPHPRPQPRSHGHHDHHHHHEEESWDGLRVGILTLSDSRGLAEDKSGDALEALVKAAGGAVVERTILPDEQPEIESLLLRWTDGERLDVILTTGGTGPGPRDVTPEATRAVCDKDLPGVAELIRARGLAQTPTAVLTRGLVALRGTTLVINLPGSSRGASHGFEVAGKLVPHILRMAHGGGH